MKFVIRHELQGRVRIHLYQKEMNLRQADLLHYYICSLPGVTGVKYMRGQLMPSSFLTAVEGKSWKESAGFPMKMNA